MHEKEKMMTSRAYLASDPQLRAERQHAKEVYYDYNTHFQAEPERCHQRLAQLLCTEHPFYIEAPFRCDYGYNLRIGKHFYANFGLVVLDGAPITIGDNVLCGPNVQLYTASHPLDASLRSAGWEISFPITIGNNVWLGGNVVVTPGVTIGDNSVIGAGSVVTRDIPDNVVAAGNPCRILRAITVEDAVAFQRYMTSL